MAFLGAGWQVTTLGRSSTETLSHLRADLLLVQKTVFKTVTHLFYAAFKPDSGVKADENVLMLENLVSVLREAGVSLERLIFIQGGKVYGAHLGGYKTLAHESDSRLA